jgi:hypothetical protein
MKTLDSVLAERDEALGLLKELIADDWVGWGDDGYGSRWVCFWCHADSGEDTDMSADDAPEHKPSCPVHRARALLGMRQARVRGEEG